MANVVKAHMTGVIGPLKVEVGDRVSEDTIVTTIEAGLMTQNVLAEMEGVVEKVLVTRHQAIREGEPIMILSDAS
jgi:biotin carboxyl carrier protein